MILWQPTQEIIKKANITRLFEKLAPNAQNYDDYHQFSLQHSEKFYRAVLADCDIIGGGFDGPFMQHSATIYKNRFFPNATINLAENIFAKCNMDARAIVFWGENGQRVHWSYRDLYQIVSQIAGGLRQLGVQRGDRVGAYLPNCPEAVAVCLATASLGAVFTSCSPDFGVQGVIDRFGQTAPKVVFGCDGYFYHGKTLNMREKLHEICEKLPECQKMVVINFANIENNMEHAPHNKITPFDQFITQNPPPLQYERVGFNDPLFIMYSSGTTGAPKCIVHGVGNVLLKLAVEHTYHTDLRAGDTIFFFSTLGWMMWNWLVLALARGVAIALYDGSPFYPSNDILWQYAEQEGFTQFGAGAKYYDTLRGANQQISTKYKLPHLRAILSTGSPLVHESFQYIYDHIKGDVWLASVSGGTDILGCFFIGVPIKPVVKGELQVACLGLDMQAYNDDGKPISDGKGELVCQNPFPSMPIYFWQDNNDQKFHNAYFAVYPNIWHHGDFLEKTPTGYIIHGRSDATLNPGGVRIGTAEIYRQVETLAEIMESVVIGQDYDNDTRVILFVKMRPPHQLTPELVAFIKNRIKINCSPRHIPAKILAVADIPRTKSGKIVELAVRDVVAGRTIKNKEALANPESLEFFANLPELQ